MDNDLNGLRIPMQVGTEFRIKKDGSVSLDNPEIELAPQQSAADAVLSYRFDPQTGDHIVRLLEPVANRKHMRVHQPND